MKFKVGDIITPKQYCHGFCDVEITGIVTDMDRECYKVKIPNGIATIPIIVENNYELSKNKS
jgi:hypothetical protein